MNREQRIAILREWIRNPNFWIGPNSPTGLHRQYLADIWGWAMQLSAGDPAEALVVATEAVKSGHQPNEPNEQYTARLNGLPSRTFGAGPPYSGVDKLQHFFRSAAIAYTAGPSVSESAGIFWEVLDWLGSVFKSTGGFDEGDLWADNLGAAFGATLRWNPNQPIQRFLQEAPHPGDAVVLPLGLPYLDGSYVAEAIVPSPRDLENGQLVELRCVDPQGFAYAMSVSLNPQDEIQYSRLDSSAYRLAPNDPWYVSPAPPVFDEETMKRQYLSMPSIQELQIDHKVESGRHLHDRLQMDLAQLRSQHDLLNQQMGQRVSDQQLQEMMFRDQDLRARMNIVEQHLGNTSQALENLRRDQEAFQQQRLQAFQQAHPDMQEETSQLRQFQEEQSRRLQETQQRESARALREQQERDHSRQQEELNRQIRERHPMPLVVTGAAFPDDPAWVGAHSDDPRLHRAPDPPPTWDGRWP